jgi:signal transduction histidine kinase
MAAHLHDSVLQTLALIQRTDDPKRMITLARGQERELREWLYRSQETESADSLGDAIREHASRVESGHDLPIEVVVVGDAPMTEALQALGQAAGEAMTNAAKHSGAEKISVYVEIAGDAAEIYVGDTGEGFDPATVTSDHRGIADSITGRMQRYGGEARIESAPGAGTEIYLRMPRSP